MPNGSAALAERAKWLALLRIWQIYEEFSESCAIRGR